MSRALRGYFTRYDCSSADINPIGSISKKDLKRFISWARTEFDLPILKDFLTATPTAELEPITKDYVQSDEADMGMTYDELSDFGYAFPMTPQNLLLHLLVFHTPLTDTYLFF